MGECVVLDWGWSGLCYEGWSGLCVGLRLEWIVLEWIILD